MIKKLKWISLLALLVISFASYGQTKICGDIESFHPIDKELFELRNQLQYDGFDTIIIYSHWIYMNGFNGYGRVVWKKDGKIFQLNLNYDKERSKVIVDDTVKLHSDTIFTFFFDNHLHSISNNPAEQDIHMSHDGRHFVSITWGNNQDCFTITNLLVQFNPVNKRAQWINFFKEEGTDTIQIR